MHKEAHWERRQSSIHWWLIDTIVFICRKDIPHNYKCAITWVWFWIQNVKMKQCLHFLFSFQKCWSNSSSSFVVLDSPSGNVNKKWSSLEAVRGFKVKDRFPSKSVQRQQGTSEKFDGDQLCYGLSDLDLMVVDVHLNLCGETQWQCFKKFDGYLFCYGFSNLDLMVECDDHILPTGKRPHTLTQVLSCCSLL
jgi:hypothetical protein